MVKERVPKLLNLVQIEEQLVSVQLIVDVNGIIVMDVKINKKTSIEVFLNT